MPLLHLHLLRLRPGHNAVDVAQQLHRQKDAGLILAAQPHHWVVKPSKLDIEQLTREQWDLMLLIQQPEGSVPGALPTALSSAVTAQYTVPVGVPSKLLANYAEKNAALLRQAPSVPLTGALERALQSEPGDSQNLELSADLRSFMHAFTKSHGEQQPVTMLNLLCFNAGDGKAEYAKYGQTFRETGGRRGGDAKIVGNVIRDGKITEPAAWFNEVAIVHYPSIRHFCDMAAGEDYQAGNHKYRLKALYDTILLCTTEIPLDRIDARL